MSLHSADYAIMQIIMLNNITTTAHIMIAIRDDNICEFDEKVLIILKSLSDCAVTNSPVPVYIIDNDGKFNNNTVSLVQWLENDD